MPPKKSLTTLLKELSSQYEGLSKEDATQQILAERTELYTHREELKEQYAVVESKKKGSITVQRNHVEAKLAALDKFLETLTQPPLPNGTLSVPPSNSPPPGINAPFAPPARGATSGPVIKIPARAPPSSQPPPAASAPAAPPAGGASSGSAPPPPIKGHAPSPSLNPPPAANVPALPSAGGASSGSTPPPLPIKIPARAPTSNQPPPATNMPPAPPAGGASSGPAPPPTIKGHAPLPSLNCPPAASAPAAPPAGGASSGLISPPPYPNEGHAPATSPNPPPAANVAPPPSAGGTTSGSVPPPVTTPAQGSSHPVLPDAHAPPTPRVPLDEGHAPATSPNPPPAANVPPPPSAGGTTSGSVPPPVTTPAQGSSHPVLPDAHAPPTPRVPLAGGTSGATPPPPLIRTPAEPATGEARPSRPHPRPVPRKEKGLTDGSQLRPLVVEDDDDVKPVIPPAVRIDANMDQGTQMKVLTAEQSLAITDLLRDVAGESAGPSSRKKRKNTSEGGRNKKTKTSKQEEGGGGELSVRGKRSRNEPDEAGASVSKKPKPEPEEMAGRAVVKRKGKSRKIEEGSSESEGDGVKIVRRRAEKERKTCWIFIVVLAIIQPGGATVNARIRVLAPVDESESKRVKLNLQGWTEVHNYIVGGLNPSCAVLSRAKQFRWFCREIGALSTVLIWSVFINRNKRTRCHFHASTDRASAHNDVQPKVSKATREPAHIVTGVGLPQDDTLLASAKALRAWGDFKTKKCTTELAGARDSSATCCLTIGGMTKEDLLSFFRLENGRYYLGCGCDLLHATFDFFLWKVAPPLFSGTVDGSVECVGPPWDVRLRPTLIALFSSMGLSLDNLDTVMKYNINGQKNDLSLAPEFVRDFWTLNRALKSAQWRKVGPSTPPPRHRRTDPGYIDPDDIQGVTMGFDLGQVSDSNSDSDSDSDSDRGKKPVPKANTLRSLNLSDFEEEEEPFPAGEHGVGNDREKCGKEGMASTSTPMLLEEDD